MRFDREKSIVDRLLDDAGWKWAHEEHSTVSEAEYVYYEDNNDNREAVRFADHHHNRPGTILLGETEEEIRRTLQKIGMLPGTGISETMNHE